MRELDRIHRGLADALERGEAVVLVTVLGVEGSVYRGAGARMIVSANGETIGAVSGGCLEADIVARAPDFLAAGAPQLVRYDTRVSDDVVLGLGLGCQGLIDLLLEPLSGDALRDAIAFYARLRAHREPVALLTSLRSDAGGPSLGARAVVDEQGRLVEGNATLLGAQGGVAREIVRPAISLVVCGAGTDAMPLVRLATLMGWDVSVVDHRAGFVTPARFPGANVLVCANLTRDAGALAGRLTLDARTVAVVMAHSAAHDAAYLHAMLHAGAGYIGVLGPARRTRELLAARGAGASDLPPAVHAPVGLDLGAETPEEIALSIVAEIAAVSAGRTGGMLRERRGPIHDRPSHTVEVDV